MNVNEYDILTNTLKCLLQYRVAQLIQITAQIIEHNKPC